jgi:phosphatidyl-myo-inositol dimannoside synthase|uniref:glycosyltransferase family 4 protein n=2 Tax=Candidatus Planktophila sp. TaxID=2175601 RepID=UPI00404B5D08
MPKEIICITNDFGPRAGGIETFVMGLIERLPVGSVTVYTSQQGDTRAYDQNWFDKFGVRVIRDKSKVLLPTPRVFRAVRRVIVSEEIESIFFGAAAPLAVMAGGLRKAGAKKLVALTHGHEVWWARIWPFNWAIGYIGRSVDHLTYLGDFTRAKISRALSQKSISAMVKIAPGIDTAHFAPSASATQLRQSLGLTNKKVIVSVGRLVHRKGQDYLISALPEILRHHPDTHILMVGEGPYRKKLEALTVNLALKNSITFIGRIQYADLPSYICVGDLFAMPSRSRLAGLEVEGLGIVYLEASACGLPVIAGKSGGAPDAVLEGVTGVTVDGRNSSDIARAAIALLDDLDEARAMGARGREWVISNWHWETWAKEFGKLLRIN